MTHSIGISRNPVLVSSAVETAILCTNIARPGHNLDINLSLGFISYLSSGLLYLFLLTIYFVGDRQGKYSKSFILLLLATLIWSVLLTLSQVGASTAFSLVTVAELLRYFTWFYLLHSAAGYYLQDKQGFRFSNPITPISVAVMFTISLATLFANDFLVELFDIANPVAIQILWNLIFSVLGLLLIEQVIRNTPASERGSIGFLCISAGAIFGYDFFVYSNAFLLQQIDYEFWSARGIVNIVVVPTLLLAAVRNPEMAPRLHVSRQFVFHSTTLIAAGGYLLLMSVVGYYVEQTSTEWGKLIQTGFLFAALLLLAVLFYTPQIKTRLKRYLSYSFRNKYDYREEWIRFSQTLLLRDPEVPIYQLAVQAIGQIVDSRGGSLWIKDSRQFIFKSSWKTSVEQTKAESEDSPMIQFIKL
ncbi:MAG: putative PEP-CTERM system histidine kinase, partial [Gammaproteobacteria bacterium]